MENNKALRPGTVLGGKTTYRIERVLGAGGFGITYLASCEALVGSLRVKAFVAVKEHFLSSHCERAADTTSVVCPGTQDSRALVANSLRDFIAEARRLADYGAGHPNIVKVNEIFEANGTAYYVMEYLEGESLYDYICANGALDEQSIRSLVYPIIDTVAYLHAKHVTHLDIKPGNIMLAANADGTVRPVLIDFGLSKHYNADGSATSTVNTMACSDGFAPLEQYKGIRTFSPAADVYALGATLYNAATGRSPSTAGEFPFGEPAATIAALPLSERLRTVMTRAMAALAVERYPDAGAMLTALGIESARTAGVATAPISRPDETKAFAVHATPAAPEPAPAPQSTPSSPEPATRPNRKGMIIGAVIAAVVFILLCGLGISLFVDAGQERERQEQEAAAEPERIQQQRNQSRTAHNLDLAVRASDGQTYYFNQSNWRSLMQPGDEQLGVVIIKDGQRFILSLTCTIPMTWDEAMSRYSDVMPTKEQGEAMASQHEDVDNAIRSFGGNVPDFNVYWTKTEYNSDFAWFVIMADGTVDYYNESPVYRVRAVAPVPVSSAI